MMKLAQRLSFLNRSDSHCHTSAFARRAVLVLSLLVFCLGSVWGQVLYKTIELTLIDGNKISSSEYIDHYNKYGNDCKIEFTFNSTQYKGNGWGFARLCSYDGQRQGIELVHDLHGVQFTISCSMSDFVQSGDEKGVFINAYNGTQIVKVVLSVPIPFTGQLKDDAYSDNERMEVTSRSAASTNIDFSSKLSVTPKYARFYLTDAYDNPVSPVGLLEVNGSTLCKIAEDGYYLYNNGNELSNISVKLKAPDSYKLYKVVGVFSYDLSRKKSNGDTDIPNYEPDWDYQCTYSFYYPILNDNDTKTYNDNDVEWRLSGMTPSVTNYNPDGWGTISSAELAVERYVKWYVVKDNDKQPLAEYNRSRLEGKWTIGGYPVLENTDIAGKMENGASSFPVCTIYAPAGQVYNDVKDYKVVCEIYANSTGAGSPNARYTFSLYKSFLGELKNSTKKGEELVTLENGEVESVSLDLSKITTAWGSTSRPKYARVWLTTNDGTLVNPNGILSIPSGMTAYESKSPTDATYGYYLANENGISLNNITATLTLDAGVYDHYQVHVALSTEALSESKEYEPDYDYLYTFSFGYPWKTKYKTLIIDSTNEPTVTPNLISNWLELANDCGVNKQTLANKLFVRWYFEDQYGNEIENSGFNATNYTKINNRKGYYRNKNFNAGNLHDQGIGGEYKYNFKLWEGERSNYKNIRLVCVVSTKTDSYNPNIWAWKDPEIQVKYVYNLIKKDERKLFAHYEGEAYRYLKEIGDDNQAKDYDYIEVDGETPTENYTWNISANDYNATPDTRNIRQNVHTVDYYYYVEPGDKKELLLPLQDYATGGSSTEPMAYFRWYDYQTDKKSHDLTNLGNSLYDIADWGSFATKTGTPTKNKIGVTFQAPTSFGGEQEIQIACDVSRYMDGMDESFNELVHEPTLSIRYLFHIRPASKIAADIAKAGDLSRVEADIRDPEKAKPTLILEDEGRTVVSTNNGYGEFALRTKLSSLDNYYYNHNGNLKQANSLWWYVYYKDNAGNWWRHLIENKPYLDRDGRTSYGTTTYRTQKHQAKYSLADKQWPDFNNSITTGDFKGTWQQWNDGSGWVTVTTEKDKPSIGVGDRVQMVACVDYNSGYGNNAQPKSEEEIRPIIWTELEFIDAKPLVLEAIKNADEDGDKSIWERTAVYMNEHYGDENKKPKALLDFNEFSLLGMKRPTHSYENYATVPLHYPNAQYGFIYPQLYGYCATQRDNGIFGMAPMHGDYTLLKSMNMPGISMDKEANNPGAQSIQVNWVTIPDVSNNYPLFDVSYERKNGKNTSLDGDDYGGFLYVDAADEARTIASLEFDAKLCEDAKIYYTAYVASMTGLTRSKEVTGSTGWYPSDNQTPQTAPSLRFRVSALNAKGERVPVVTFVTGNIRQEVSYDPNAMYNTNIKGKELRYEDSPFKEAHWYQVYGYTTIPKAAGLELNGETRHFFVEIDNYCDNTDGADYCVDQISFYTNNAKLSVIQAAQTNCAVEGTELNIYLTADEVESVKARDGYIYWRICDSNGDPVMDKDVYGEFLVEGDYEVPFGRTLVSEESLEDQKYFGYFSTLIDGKERLCFSLANQPFSLTQGSDHYISVFSNGDHDVPTDGKSVQGWGNQDDICTVYSKIFVPKVMYVSIGGLEGGSTPIINADCPGNVARLVNFKVVLNVPDTKSDTGFTPYESVHFDFFKGTREELQEKKYTDTAGKTFSLEDAINYYRNYNGIAEKEFGKGNLPWNHEYNILPDDSENDGLDPNFGKDKNAEYYKYYEVIRAAIEEKKLYLSYSNTLSNLTVEKGDTTIWALSADVNMTDNYGVEHLVCSPLPLNFKLKNEVEHPAIMLGFSDVDYGKNNIRVVRVGKEQLDNMQQENGFLLHIPVNTFNANRDKEDIKGELAIISEGLELLKYDDKLVGKDDVLDKWTNDEGVDGNRYVATFAETVISEKRAYISLNFHGQMVKDNIYKFKEGFTYRMFFQVKNNAKYNDDTACEGNVEFLMKVVPEYVTWNDGIMLENGQPDPSKVTGANKNVNRNWNNDKNWSRSKKDELYSNTYKNNGTASDETGASTTPATFVPMKFTYVTIPSKNVAPKLVNLTLGEEEKVNKDIYTNINDVEGEDDEDNKATDGIEYDLMVRYSPDPADEQNTCIDHGIGGNVYDCEKFYGNVCKEIYFKPEAELINQQFLTYEKAWVEKELVANKWYLMSTPLKATYAGDMYVPTAKGRQETEAFQPIKFTDKVEDNAIYSRTGYPVYQRSWGTKFGSKVYYADNKSYDAGLSYSSVTTAMAEWGHTYNDVKVPYTTLSGFSIRAHKEDQTKPKTEVEDETENVLALIRLPKDDTEYYYYDWKGNPVTGSAVEVRKTSDGIGKFVTDQGNAEVTLLIENAQQNENAEGTDDAQKKFKYIVVGNPYMASLDMQQFFDINTDLEKAYYTYEESSSKSHGTSGKIRPLQAFFVKMESSKITDAKIMFTADMMMDGNHGTPTPALSPARPMTMTAANGRGQSAANVSVGEEAKSVATLFDSNLNDVPMVYTVADGQAVSINQVTGLDKPIAFGVTCAANDEPVDVTFSDIAQLTSGEVYVVDAANGSKQQVTEGGSYSVQPNDYGRYFLTFAGGTTGISEAAGIGVVVSVRGRMVTVTSGETLTEVRAISPDGATVYRDTAGSTTASFTLAPGVYVVKAENAAGEQQTVKVIVK